MKRVLMVAKLLPESVEPFASMLDLDDLIEARLPQNMELDGSEQEVENLCVYVYSDEANTVALADALAKVVGQTNVISVEIRVA